MLVILQRVLNASVTVEDVLINSIERGMILFVCIEKTDTAKEILRAAKKVAGLRIFSTSSSEKLDANLQAVSGEILSISQFTLSWDGTGGFRPSFERAAKPLIAEKYYNDFNDQLRREGSIVKTGKFGSNMQVQLLNDGPVTLQLRF